eukprot:4664514-Prymnesium_polylepis.2
MAGGGRSDIGGHATRGEWRGVQRGAARSGAKWRGGHEGAGARTPPSLGLEHAARRCGAHELATLDEAL